MTGGVDLGTIQKTLSEMQIAAALPTANSSSAVDSFATTLAQARNDLSSGGVSSQIGQPLSPGASASDSGLIELLLSMQQRAGSVGASGVASPPVPSLAGGFTGKDVVREATGFEGTPYVWGGSTPGGFDCSGLVQYVYAQVGIDMPRTSQRQASVGTPVASLDSAQSGDLIFFAGSDGTASAPGHVGIYVGNGEMIDAPYTGTHVQVHSVSSAGAVVAIRRVLAGP